MKKLTEQEMEEAARLIGLLATDPQMSAQLQALIDAMPDDVCMRGAYWARYFDERLRKRCVN
jgi:hypothetical protein